MSPIYYCMIKRLDLLPCKSKPAVAVKRINLTTANNICRRCILWINIFWILGPLNDD